MHWLPHHALQVFSSVGARTDFLLKQPTACQENDGSFSTAAATLTKLFRKGGRRGRDPRRGRPELLQC